MGNLKVDTWELGNDFHTVSKKAQALSTEKQNVEFEFNGVACVVSMVYGLEKITRNMKVAIGGVNSFPPIIQQPPPHPQGKVEALKKYLKWIIMFNLKIIIDGMKALNWQQKNTPSIQPTKG